MQLSGAIQHPQQVGSQDLNPWERYLHDLQNLHVSTTIVYFSLSILSFIAEYDLYRTPCLWFFHNQCVSVSVASKLGPPWKCQHDCSCFTDYCCTCPVLSPIQLASSHSIGRYRWFDVWIPAQYLLPRNYSGSSPAYSCTWTFAKPWKSFVLNKQPTSIFLPFISRSSDQESCVFPSLLMVHPWNSFNKK